MMGSPHYRDSAVSKRGDHHTHAIAIAIHGDGIPTIARGQSWAKSFEVYSWCSMLGEGETTTLCNFYIWMICKSAEVKAAVGNTRAVWHRVLCWSLECLWTGRWPTHDHNGARYRGGAEEALGGSLLAGGYYAVVWALKGDLEYHQNSLGLKNCFCCKANRTTMPWTDMTPKAAWLESNHTEASWRLANPSPNPLLCVSGVCGAHAPCPDLMHCKHLGTDQYFQGSVITLLLSDILPGSKAENLTQFNGELKLYWDAHLADSGNMYGRKRK